MDAPDALLSAAAGMRLQADRLDVIARNLANASTVGYREGVWTAAKFGAKLESAVIGEDRQGPLRRTGVPTDLALVGRGYFAVATPDGVRYSRDGRLTASTDGSVIDTRGNRLLGALGPVRFPSGAHVEPDGRIVADGRTVDRLRIVSFPDNLESGDGPYLCAAAGAVPGRASATVHSGYLEESGVNPIAEMTSLVAAQRAYEANQKTAQRADETLRRAVTDVPAVRP
jgi:flagellar basal-body rod protein FlgF